MGIAEPFDLEDHHRSAHGALREHFSVREFEEVPLDREAIVATAYLRAIEHATVARVLPSRAPTPTSRSARSRPSGPPSGTGSPTPWATCSRPRRRSAASTSARRSRR